MWKLFNCYVSGRHDYGMWCEAGQIFLRCPHCGKRTIGWSVTTKETSAAPKPHAVVIATPQPTTARVVPFTRAVAS